jgi:hypothetical protein
MSSQDRDKRLRRAAEILARYEQIEKVDSDECLRVPPVTVREEVQQMMDIQEFLEVMFDERGW